MDLSGEEQPVVYLQALRVRQEEDFKKVRELVQSNTIVIMNVEEMFDRDFSTLYREVKKLVEFVEQIGGSIARLGHSRIIVAPPTVRMILPKKTKAS